MTFLNFRGCLGLFCFIIIYYLGPFYFRIPSSLSLYLPFVVVFLFRYMLVLVLATLHFDFRLTCT